MESDERKYYPVNFHFELNYNGEKIAFQEVSGISKEIKVEEFGSGGENRFKYRLPSMSSSQNLILKRAIIPGGSKLNTWVSRTLNKGLSKPIVTAPILVSLLNKKGKSQMSWTFYSAYPIKYSVSDLKSDGNEVVIESIELAYTYFEKV
ncbi:MAG: phage tail protein [Flavobacteriaceae bacterium]|nr:phage tail protein [Flavobacteriaceae bacterium]